MVLTTLKKVTILKEQTTMVLLTMLEDYMVSNEMWEYFKL
jgi:hypothetical protein